MIVNLSGIGLWTATTPNWSEFTKQVIDTDTNPVDVASAAPPADIIPVREKRRVPLIARIAIEAATQACEMADADPGEVNTVFTSCMSDTEVTDYMCRALATDEKILSPTRFHNSVHNATAGYWSIFTQGIHSGEFAGAGQCSFAGGLLEAATLTATEGRATLLVAYDIANQLPLHDACAVDISLAYALLLEPQQSKSMHKGWKLEIQTAPAPQGHRRAQMPLFNTAGRINPVADGLALLTAAAKGQCESLDYRIGGGSMLNVKLTDL